MVLAGFRTNFNPDNAHVSKKFQSCCLKFSSLCSDNGLERGEEYTV